MQTSNFYSEGKIAGDSVGRFIKKEPVTVPPSATVKELVEDFIYRHQFKMFSVVEEGNRLRGCITMKQVKMMVVEWIALLIEQLRLSAFPATHIIAALLLPALP